MLKQDFDNATKLFLRFFLGITMYFNMPRHVFGSIQAKLWPIYFKLGTSLTVLALLTNGAVLRMKNITPTPMQELQVSIMEI